MNLKFWQSGQSKAKNKSATAKKNSAGAKKKSATREWIEAIVFALIAAGLIRTFAVEAYTIPTPSMEKSLMVGDFLFVSKMSYGARMPMTPIAFPLAHNTLPLLKIKSYVDGVQWKYRRLPGFGSIKNNDVVVFNYPMEDWRPVDRRDNYIKRCVGIPGDTLAIRSRMVYINGQAIDRPAGLQHRFVVRTDGSGFNPKTLEKMDVTEGGAFSAHGDFMFNLTEENADKMKQFANVRVLEPYVMPQGEYTEEVFPHHEHYPWNLDSYGPIVIPAKGMRMPLNMHNIHIYRRAIEVYEKQKLEVKDNKVYINDEPADAYTFQMDYYWMMGDNRHNSLDSRYWGFVPEDHVVGKAVFVWLSLDYSKSLFNKIRFSRTFRSIK